MSAWRNLCTHVMSHYTGNQMAWLSVLSSNVIQYSIIIIHIYSIVILSGLWCGDCCAIVWWKVFILLISAIRDDDTIAHSDLYLMAVLRRLLACRPVVRWPICVWYLFIVLQTLLFVTLDTLVPIGLHILYFIVWPCVAYLQLALQCLIHCPYSIPLPMWFWLNFISCVWHFITFVTFLFQCIDILLEYSSQCGYEMAVFNVAVSVWLMAYSMCGYCQ